MQNAPPPPAPAPVQGPPPPPPPPPAQGPAGPLLLRFVHQQESVEGVVNKIVGAILEPTKPVSPDTKKRIIDLVNSFIIRNRTLDSLEPPIEFWESKKEEMAENPGDSNFIKQVFFLTVCVFFGGSYYTKKQNGENAKVVCVDLLSFPGARDRMDLYKAREEDNNEMFLCNFPSCRIKNKSNVFSFSDVATQREVTESGKKMFYVAKESKDRKNFFRHMGMHFVGINMGASPKHDYCREFELFKAFFPTYCLSPLKNSGDVNQKTTDDPENIIFPRPFPESKAIKDVEPDPGTFEIKGDFIHFYNDNFCDGLEYDLERSNQENYGEGGARIPYEDNEDFDDNAQFTNGDFLPYSSMPNVNNSSFNQNPMVLSNNQNGIMNQNGMMNQNPMGLPNNQFEMMNQNPMGLSNNQNGMMNQNPMVLSNNQYGMMNQNGIMNQNGMMNQNGIMNQNGMMNQNSTGLLTYQNGINLSNNQFYTSPMNSSGNQDEFRL